MLKPARVCSVAVALASLVLVLLPLSLGRGWASVAPQPTVNVSVLDNRFDPPDLTVLAGARVVWTNNGNAPHTTTSGAGVWDSGTLSHGQSLSRVFNSPGTYSYFCSFHQSLGMSGVITVAAPTTQVYLPFLARNATGW